MMRVTEHVIAKMQGSLRCITWKMGNHLKHSHRAAEQTGNDVMTSQRLMVHLMHTSTLQRATRIGCLPGRHHTWGPCHCSSKKEKAPGGEKERETERGRGRGYSIKKKHLSGCPLEYHYNTNLCSPSFPLVVCVCVCRCVCDSLCELPVTGGEMRSLPATVRLMSHTASKHT